MHITFILTIYYYLHCVIITIYTHMCTHRHYYYYYYYDLLITMACSVALRSLPAISRLTLRVSARDLSREEDASAVNIL